MLVSLLVSIALAPIAGERLVLARVPQGGIQPEALVDARGRIRLLSFRGDPQGGALFVSSSEDGGRTFANELRVNDDDSRAIATGTIRGAQLALGKDGSLHVLWMGGTKARPRAPENATPLLYSRLVSGAASFTPPRNLITKAVGLDGGLSICADGEGGVAAVWHAPPGSSPGTSDVEQRETARRVWLARSSDDGATFAPEIAIDSPRHGACGCCGMRATWIRGADRRDDAIWVLYRCARDEGNRGMHALRVEANGPATKSIELENWASSTCMMSTAALAPSPGAAVLAAWETRGQVFFQTERAEGPRGAPRPAPGPARERKHPRLAVDAKGDCLLVWTEGTGWDRGGALAWQLFDPEGRAVETTCGREDGVPVWSFATPVALPDGRFVVIY